MARAKAGLDHIPRPQDAIHLATALVSNSDEFNTFDERLLKLDEVLKRLDGKPLKICKPSQTSVGAPLLASSVDRKLLWLGRGGLTKLPPLGVIASYLEATMPDGDRKPFRPISQQAGREWMPWAYCLKEPACGHHAHIEHRRHHRAHRRHAIR